MYIMYPHYYGGGFFGFGILPILIILGIIFLIWAIFAHHDSDTSENEEITGEDSALEILKKRYAKGEITKRQFIEMKKDIG